MKKDARLQLRVDAKLKKQAETAAKRRGSNLSAMVTEYLRTVVAQDRIEREVVDGRGLKVSSGDGVEQI